MPESSLIQRFFDASLIPSDTTDERLGHYQSAATNLAGRFESEPELVPMAASVAIDSNCPASEPFFEVVEAAVKEHWKTFLVNNNDKPRQICRAILLEALEKRADGNDLVAATIWNSSANLLECVEGGQDQELVSELVLDMGRRCENYAASIWRPSPNPTDALPKFELKIPAAKTSKVDQEALKAAWLDAAGPNTTNRYGSNQGQVWSNIFIPLATTAVATAIDGSVASMSPTIKSLNTKLTSTINEHFDLISKWVTKSQKSNERLTSLLWWKEALYSPCLKQSYRGVQPAELAFVAAYDLSQISGAPVPQSVEYFLSETILKVFPKDPKLTLNQVITAFNSSELVGTVTGSFGEIEDGRVSLSEFLSIASDKKIAKTSQARVGIKPSISLHLTEWAKWFLHDNVTRQLVGRGTQS
jgi:hypothetical protein